MPSLVHPASLQNHHHVDDARVLLPAEGISKGSFYHNHSDPQWSLNTTLYETGEMFP